MNVIAILFALFSISISYREYFYVKALGGREAMDKMFLHLGVSAVALFVPFVTFSSSKIPSFVVPLISIILSYGASYSAFVGAHDLVRARYHEYQEWARDLLVGPYSNPFYDYKFDPFYRPGPEPMLPEEYHLPLFILELTFEEYFDADLTFKDKTALKAQEMRAKKLAKKE